MVATKRVKPRDGFKVDYLSIFGMGWLPYINSLISSEYMHNLMVYLDQIYNVLPGINKRFPIVYPNFPDLFENFRMCGFLETKVVIIGKEPFTNSNANGIPFGNDASSSGPSQSDTILLERCIRKTVHGNRKNNYFDETMYSWATQGVLMLDSSSTSIKQAENAHQVFWRNFNRQIVKILSDKKENIIFLLLGKEASYFTRYIDKKKHKILHYCHPSDMGKQNKDWNCPHFKTIDEILEKKYGDKRIYW